MLIIDSLEDAGVADSLKTGAVGVLPTDTVYGIVTQATDQDAVARLYATKHREGKPGTVIAASIAQLNQLGIEQQYLDMVQHIWPNPVSIVLPAGESLAYLHLGLDSLAVRVVADTSIRRLLEQTGPLLTSSANMPGEEPANNTEEAIAYFGDTVDFYVRGDATGRAASTVGRLNQDGSIETLRQGQVSIN